MSLNRQQRNRLLAASVSCLLVALIARDGLSQRPVHQLYRSDMPPGLVGASQIAASVDRYGYVQPVRVIVPTGAVSSLASDGEFLMATTDLRAGLMVGQPYRLRITNIPRYENRELYPSIEVIDRLHPPRGQKNRFPIPIEITQDDLELALRGSMVVRVIYLENPNDAFPESEDGHQRYLDVLPAEDPLHVADELGRPMAILRLGSRVPMNSNYDSNFLFGSPPVNWIGNNEGGVPANDQDDPFVDDQVN